MHILKEGNEGEEGLEVLEVVAVSSEEGSRLQSRLSLPLYEMAPFSPETVKVKMARLLQHAHHQTGTKELEVGQTVHNHVRSELAMVLSHRAFELEERRLYCLGTVKRHG